MHGPQSPHGQRPGSGFRVSSQPGNRPQGSRSPPSGASKMVPDCYLPGAQTNALGGQGGAATHRLAVGLPRPQPSARRPEVWRPHPRAAARRFRPCGCLRRVVILRALCTGCRIFSNAPEPSLQLWKEGLHRHRFGETPSLPFCVLSLFNLK